MSSTEPLPVSSHGPLQPRRRERRMGVESLLAVVGRALVRPTSSPSLREAFEDGLRHVLPIRAGQLRRGGSSGNPALPLVRQAQETGRAA